MVNLSYAQTNTIGEEIEEIQQQLDVTSASIDSMDDEASQLEEAGQDLESQLDDVGEKIEAAELDLEQKHEKSSWARLMKFGILAIAIFAVFLIFKTKKQRK